MEAFDAVFARQIIGKVFRLYDMDHILNAIRNFFIYKIKYTCEYPKSRSDLDEHKHFHSNED